MSFAVPGWTGSDDQKQIQRDLDRSFSIREDYDWILRLDSTIIFWKDMYGSIKSGYIIDISEDSIYIRAVGRVVRLDKRKNNSFKEALNRAGLTEEQLLQVVYRES